MPIGLAVVVVVVTSEVEIEITNEIMYLNNELDGAQGHCAVMSCIKSNCIVTDNCSLAVGHRPRQQRIAEPVLSLCATQR